MIGKVISHYRIIEKLGAGGMGVVYKAEDIKLDRIVAMKFLPKQLLGNQEAKTRFANESRTASALNHPNITTIYEIDEAEDECFICMEYIEGKSIKQLIKEKILSIEEILKIAVQIGQGLHAAHKRGIVHRDLKSENIMLTNEGLIKIMDFGLAKLTGVSGLTLEGTTLGTVPYMSPEQVQGIEVDHRSDIFSLGVVLYEMVTGQLPFRGEHEAAVIYSIINDTPEPLARYKANVPEGLQRVVDKALAKKKDERYQGVEEMTTNLCALQQQMQPVVKMRKQRVKLPVVVGSGMVLVVLMVLGYFLLWPRPVTSSKKSIAVLPFVDMSPQKDQEYFCDGMTEELINRLSNIQDLRVPARTSAFMFKGKTEDIREVGSKLNVQTVLEGSVRKAGDELRITAQLINVNDGYHLWAEKYDRKIEDVFAIQDEISSAIVNALRLKLTSEEAKRLSERPIDDIKAYDCYLKAERLILRYDEKSLDSAFVYLQTAIDIMGDNAQLYAGMAYAYWQYANMGMGQEEYLRRLEEYVAKALDLKPDLSSALAMLGMLHIYKEYPQNIHDAIRDFKKALEANPFELRALTGMAISYAMIGKPFEAYTFTKTMENHDPLNPWWHSIRGYCYLYDCQFGPALEQSQTYYRADSTSPMAKVQYSWALTCNGKRDEALAVINDTGLESTHNVQTVFYLLLKYALLKDKGHALHLMTPEFQKTCRRDAVWSYMVAARLSLLGSTEEALDWLENAISRGFINYPLFQCDPFLDNIRGEERFEKLAEHAKYEWEHFEVPE
jgi:serine/threonine protein kinase/tetratricopeptide (TPR) repeat protein